MRLILFVFLFSSAFFLAEGRAEENPGRAQLLSEIEQIKTRLASVEKQQQDIIAKDNEIIEKLDQLRIWVHRK